jgi:tRNA A37 threonylcarbamoyladenosine dehydratase
VTPEQSAVAEPFEGFERRFGALRRLYGAAGAQRIFAAHVVVVGIGGVGSWAAEALARSGVGRLTLIDLDHLAESNVNRQLHALCSTLGQSKVEAMQQRIAQINPAAQVHALDDFVTPANWDALLQQTTARNGQPQALIDACDQRSAKETLAAWALRSPLHFITCGAAGGKRQAQRIEVADLSAVTHDPLLARLRAQLRRAHAAAAKGPMGLNCVFSREPVAPPDPSCSTEGAGDGSLNCHGYGSSVAVTAGFGMVAASWVLERLAGAVRAAGSKGPRWTQTKS